MPRAIVLAGGPGVRMYPYTAVLPRPLMPVGDRPVLDILIRQLRRHGFDHITIATGWLAELIEAYFGDGRQYGIRIDYHRERERLGTIGAIACLEDLDEPFLVVNGDVLTDLDFGALLRHHRQTAAAATIAAVQREVQISLGVLRFTHGTEELSAYDEKPRLGFSASAGVSVLTPAALACMQGGERLDFPELIQRLLARGELVCAYRSTCYWLDVGNDEDYERAVEEFAIVRDRLMPREREPDSDLGATGAS